MVMTRTITREEQVSRIKQMGQWIVDNASNILGEYPGAGITEIVVTCDFKLNCSEFDSLEIKREHLLAPEYGQPNEKIYWDEYSYE